jgi:hypothetical protein
MSTHGCRSAFDIYMEKTNRKEYKVVEEDYIKQRRMNVKIWLKFT